MPLLSFDHGGALKVITLHWNRPLFHPSTLTINNIDILVDDFVDIIVDLYIHVDSCVWQAKIKNDSSKNIVLRYQAVTAL
jgi:hypothetical protein